MTAYCVRGSDYNIIAFVLDMAMKPFISFSLLIVFITLTSPNCSALSILNSPCDVGGGYFFYLPDHGNEGWHIYYEDGTQKTICYHTDNEDGFIPSRHPEYDFDETWVYISDTISEPKYAEPISNEENSAEEEVSERRLPSKWEGRDVYFLFNKETREMTGPMTLQEFSEHPAVLGKNFDWKRGDYKNTKGFGWLILLGFAFFVVLPAFLFFVLFYLLAKLAVWVAFGKQETKYATDIGSDKSSLNANEYPETNNPYQPPDDP